MEYNIYCDESCHIEHDGNNLIVLGGIKCNASRIKDVSQDIVSIKEEFGYKKESEIKWTKVSPGNVKFYKALVDYYFQSADLSFRGYIGLGKDELYHDMYSQNYNEWYYKMYYRMLEFVIDQDVRSFYNIYLDIKDTIGNEKVHTMKAYLNSHYRQGVIKKIQLVRSHEVAMVQLVDLFIGALSYKNRCLNTSSAKLELIDQIEQYSGRSMLSTIPPNETSTNWFVWTPEHWRFLK